MADVPEVAVPAIDRLLGNRHGDVKALGVLDGVLSALDVLRARNKTLYKTLMTTYVCASTIEGCDGEEKRTRLG